MPQICKQDVVNNGLNENKKLIMDKIDETKHTGALNGKMNDEVERDSDEEGDD